MELPGDVREAQSYLEKAEQEEYPERKINALKEGISLLELYLEEHPDAPEDTVTYITNLRRAHARRLLGQLIQFNQIDVEIWFEYIILLITRLKDEVHYAVANDPTLKASYDEFWHMWEDELRKAVSKYADGEP